MILLINTRIWDTIGLPHVSLFILYSIYDSQVTIQYSNYSVALKVITIDSTCIHNYFTVLYMYIQVEIR